MKKVITFGTFDVFHLGHESYLRQARKFGDRLVVVVARDKSVLKIKKQEAVNNEQRRLKKIKASQLADEVVLGDLKDKYKILKEYRPDVVALGYDQKVDMEELQGKLKKIGLNAKIIRLNPFKLEIYKSSKFL